MVLGGPGGDTAGRGVNKREVQLRGYQNIGEGET
jgi:hypothetical protein